YFMTKEDIEKAGIWEALRITFSTDTKLLILQLKL
ncbi:unnamed protein product, partial [marine sediment metagenome]